MMSTVPSQFTRNILNSKARKPLHYAWLITAACMLLFMCVCGMITTSFSRYLPYLRDSIGLTNTQTELIQFVRIIVSMLAILIVGKVYKKVSLRAGMTVANLLLALSCVFFAHAHSIWPCLMAAVLMGLSYSFGSIYPMSRILANWFKEGRSTAMSVVSCGSGITAIIMPHVISISEGSWGLKGAFYLEMMIILAVTLAVFLILRDNPSELGMEPLVLTYGEKREKKKVLTGPYIEGKWFWLLLGAVFLNGGGGLTSVNNIALHLKTTGFADSKVSLALSLFGVSMIVGKLSYGIVADAIGGYPANYLFFILISIGCFMSTLIGPDQTVMALIGSFLIGLGAAMGSVGMTRWSADLSRPERYAESVRIAQFWFSLGGMAFSVVPGILADKFGNYKTSYALFGFLLLASLVTIQKLYHKRMHR